jgi:hypothetical protein
MSFDYGSWLSFILISDAENNNEGSDIVLPPPDNFLVLIMKPIKVKYLRLSDNFAQLDKLVTLGYN